MERHRTRLARIGWFKELGRRIADAREKRGMTQLELGEAAGVSHDTLSKLERGSGNPRIATLVMVAAVLRVPLSRLIPPYPKGLDPRELFGDDEDSSTG